MLKMLRGSSSSSSFLGFLYFLLLFTSCNAAAAAHSYGEKTQVLSVNKLQWREGYSLSTACSPHRSRKENGATILEMKHTDFRCSGGPSVMNWDQWQLIRLSDDEIRVGSIQSRIKIVDSEQESAVQTPITSGLKLQTLNYIVTITIGTSNMTVIVDTGSDLTWVQCQPCASCYSQPQPLYNPESSPSYLSVPCNDSACRALKTGNLLGLCGQNSSLCDYAVSYGDGSYTDGELGRDRLVLGSTSFEGFVFGCGKNNKGLFGSASGLMGLGRSEVSLVSQTSDVFRGVFSYCLPSSTDADNSEGSLVFGGDSLGFKNSTPISYTAMVQNPQLYSFYILNLTTISIGGVGIQYSSRNGMIILDSGTVVSRFPPTVYQALKAEILKQFSGYPTASGFSILDTCFDLSAYDEVNVPTVKLQFEGGAELSVDVTGIFYFVKRDASQVCLALASLAYEDDIGIIGNYQQRNTRIIYNTKNSQVGFAKETCSFM